MKFLIVGDAGSIFIKEYIEYVLLDANNQIVLLQENPINSSYRAFYDENSIVLAPRHGGLISRIPRVRADLGAQLFVRDVIKKHGDFDVVHVHGLNVFRGNIAKYIRKHTKRLFITVWGDELLRKNERTLKRYERYYQIADRITVATEYMKDRFLSAYGTAYTERLSINKFAVGVLDYIDRCKAEDTREELCQAFGLDSGKIHVLVGHNGREAQRHFELTEAVGTLDDRIKQKIELVYTMTYGVKDDAYLKTLEAQAKKTRCSFRILTDFLDEMSMARLRCISDILIHAQLTDAFSASMCESLYAGTVIINGAWLEYGDIPNSHSRFVEFRDVFEIPGILADVIENLNVYKEQMRENKDVIASIVSPARTTQEWKRNLNLM